MPGPGSPTCLPLTPAHVTRVSAHSWCCQVGYPHPSSIGQSLHSPRSFAALMQGPRDPAPDCEELTLYPKPTSRRHACDYRVQMLPETTGLWTWHPVPEGLNHTEVYVLGCSVPHSPGTSAVCPLSACTHPSRRPTSRSAAPAGQFQARLVLGRSAPIHGCPACVSPFTSLPRGHRLLRDSGQAAARPPPPPRQSVLCRPCSRNSRRKPAGTFQGLAARQRKPACWHSSERGQGGRPWRGEGTLRVGHAIKAFPTWSVSWTGCQRGGSGCVQIPDPPPPPLHPSTAQAAPPPAHGLPAARLVTIS